MNTLPLLLSWVLWPSNFYLYSQPTGMTEIPKGNLNSLENSQEQGWKQWQQKIFLNPSNQISPNPGAKSPVLFDTIFHNILFLHFIHNKPQLKVWLVPLPARVWRYISSRASEQLMGSDSFPLQLSSILNPNVIAFQTLYLRPMVNSEPFYRKEV